MAMQSRRLAAELKQKAYDLGFHAVGIAPVLSPEAAEDFPVEYTHGWALPRKRRGRFTQPGQALPGARSAVAVALSYLSRKNQGPAHIARFARAEDYHRVVSRRLEELSAWLKDRVPGARTLICVDTGPVLDRPLARRAGIGSYGKNALIRVPGRGSWVVLGEMLTSVPLEPDEPADFDDCGDCDVCLKACPTGSIVAPYIIDDAHCISHLTQMGGFIPRELRPLMGHTIYGCDICQEICPRNADAEETDVAEFQLAGSSGDLPALIEILNMREEEFRQRLGGKALAWIGRSRIRRNAAVALGNLRDPGAVPKLAEMLADPSPVLRAHAAWALGQIGTRAALRTLSMTLSTEKDPRVREEINLAIGGESTEQGS